MDTIGVLFAIIRLSPLLIVSHFTLGSILNSDPKGVIYLSGLVLTCIVAVGLGKLIPDADLKIGAQIVDCDNIGLNIKNISLGVVTLCFTYIYLMLIIFKMTEETYGQFNLPTIILFPILIVAYSAWLHTKCKNITALFVSASLGFVGGATWFGFVKSTGYQDLALFNGISNAAVCMKPSQALFRCTTKKK